MFERRNARDLRSSELPFAPGLATLDVSFISLRKVLPAVASCLAPDGQLLAMVKPQFEVGRERARGGVVRGAADRREAILSVAACAVDLGFTVRRPRVLEAAGAEGQSRDLRLGRPRRARDRGHRRRRARGRAMSDPERTAVVITHRNPPAASPAVVTEAAGLAKTRWRLLATSDEFEKHGEAAAGIEMVDELPERPDLCLVLGGDGSILHALRRFARTGVPVFGVNYGTVGFLAAVEPGGAVEGIRRALDGEYEAVDLPALEVSIPGVVEVALNDVAFVRRPHGRVAELSYRIAGEEVGNVRCDGIVAATPTGSTGYNLANQGPILAWGVKGYVVSYIAPHSLTARALVVAPGDVLHVGNAAGREPVDMTVDGEPIAELGPDAEAEVRFEAGVGRLAQLPGHSFYHRIREKFGHLAV